MSSKNHSELESSWRQLQTKPEEMPDLESWLADAPDTEGGYTSEDEDLDEDCKAGLDDLIDDGMLRLGNNRYHQPKNVAKAKRKAAKKSKQRNRKK